MEDVNTINNIASENVDFSMFALFMAADLVVKSVIIVLILASIYSWTIIVSKLLRLRQLKQMEKEFEEIFWSGNSFEDLYETLNFNKLDPKSKIFCAAISEWKKTKSTYDGQINSNLESLKDRMQRSI
jgi:biopolymer transport protein TolQ